jgi:hypothetical protein
MTSINQTIGINDNMIQQLEHLSGVKGGCPLEEAYYMKLSLFQGVEYFL